MDVADMTGKTVIVTGGNSGIGLETAVALAKAGAKTLITARDHGRGEAALADLRARSGNAKTPISSSSTSPASPRSEKGRPPSWQKCDRIDVLVNNAGLVLSDRRETEDGFEATFGVNHLGPFVLTELLLHRIKDSAPARIVNVASTAHKGAGKGLDFDDLQSTHGYSGMQVYSKSKLANIYFTTELARRLEGTGVTVNCLHPGTVATGIRPRRRLLGCARLRPQGHQALHPQRRAGSTHVDLPGLIARRRRCDGPVLREEPGPQALEGGPERRGGSAAVEAERGARRRHGVGLSPPRPCRCPTGDRRPRPACPSAPVRPFTMTPARSAMANAVWANCSTSRIVMPSWATAWATSS